MPKLTLLYVPTSSTREARKIAKHILAKKLAVCVNIFPVRSLYLWKGKIQDDTEVILLIKTVKNKLSSLKKEIKSLHSYDVPAIIEIPAEVSGEYGA